MFKKMGRPSRKGTATRITFEDPDGEIFYFSIDNRGKTQLLDRRANVNIGFMKEIEVKSLTPSSSNDHLAGMAAEIPSSAEQNEIINPDVQKKSEVFEKFDLFLDKINSRINMDKILRENTFTLNLFPPIIV